jgi:hypothetical protein
MRAFETGKTYILHNERSGARFRAKVVKRTKATVTFQYEATRGLHAETKTVAMRATTKRNIHDADGNLLEEASCKKLNLYTMSCFEATIQL